VPDRAEWEKAFRRAADRIAAAATRGLDASRRELTQEGRALARLDPLAQLAASRERVGLLLDRAVRSADRALATRRAALDAAGAVLPQLVTRRLATARTGIETATAALAVLDPQRTLERGYAIVRRSGDGAIVRRPDEVPPRTPLRIRVAEGDIDATVDG
ncbi:MAG TPA: exodeoxyribonuclease VII large subunit, partial [Candidatus Limnocylindrales bacterium]|nr:exodeoxyribonuclease VII large subunit [Candidatus Limnocylindrales bacterium]